jgi:hypothetical protein
MAQVQVGTLAYKDQIAPLARSRLGWAFGHQGRVPGLPRYGLPLPVSVLADEQHRRGRTDRVSLPPWSVAA